MNNFSERVIALFSRSSSVLGFPVSKKATADYLLTVISSGKVNPNNGKCTIGYNIYDNNIDNSLSLFWIQNPKARDPYVLMAVTSTFDNDDYKDATFNLIDNDSFRMLGAGSSEYTIYDSCPCTKDGVFELAKKYGMTTRTSFGHGPLVIKPQFIGSFYSLKGIYKNPNKEKNIELSKGTTIDKVQKKCDELSKLGFNVVVPKSGVDGYQIVTPKTFNTYKEKYTDSGRIRRSYHQIDSRESVIENVVFLDENQASIYLNYLLSIKPRYNKVHGREIYVGSIYGSDNDPNNWDYEYNDVRVNGPSFRPDSRISKKIMDRILK